MMKLDCHFVAQNLLSNSAIGHEQTVKQNLEMWRMRFSLILATVALAGCANTGPISTGKDSYVVSVRVPFSGQSGAKGDALRDANSFCQSMGKRMLLQNQNSSECALHGGCGEAEVNFLCLNESDSRYKEAPVMRKDNGVTTLEIR